MYIIDNTPGKRIKNHFYVLNPLRSNPYILSESRKNGTSLKWKSITWPWWREKKRSRCKDRDAATNNVLRCIFNGSFENYTPFSRQPGYLDVCSKTLRDLTWPRRRLHQFASVHISLPDSQLRADCQRRSERPSLSLSLSFFSFSLFSLPKARNIVNQRSFLHEHLFPREL